VVAATTTAVGVGSTVVTVTSTAMARSIRPRPGQDGCQSALRAVRAEL